MGKIWDAIERDEYRRYDAFVVFIRDSLIPRGIDNDMQAYNIEDEIHSHLARMFRQLENKYD